MERERKCICISGERECICISGERENVSALVERENISALMRENVSSLVERKCICISGVREFVCIGGERECICRSRAVSLGETTVAVVSYLGIPTGTGNELAIAKSDASQLPRYLGSGSKGLLWVQ